MDSFEYNMIFITHCLDFFENYPAEADEIHEQGKRAWLDKKKPTLDSFRDRKKGKTPAWLKFMSRHRTDIRLFFEKQSNRWRSQRNKTKSPVDRFEEKVSWAAWVAYQNHRHCRFTWIFICMVDKLLILIIF